MTLPSISDYQDAVQNPKTAFLDPILQNSRLVTNPLGLPNVLSGGFALTYRLETANAAFAVRCFHKLPSDLSERYQAIDRHLAPVKDPLFQSFSYHLKGIRTRNGVAPIVCMPWVRGETLGSYLSARCDASVFANLRQCTQDLDRKLRAYNVAHGDLQNGNIIVTTSGFSVIDYDGMFVPALGGRRSNELGHADFQHPKRDENFFNGTLDRFSLIVLDLSFCALISRPDLLKYFNADNIIFTKSDYLDPRASTLFKVLDSVAPLRSSAEDFRAICTASADQVPSLSDFLLRRNIPREVLVISPLSKRYVSAHRVIDANNFQVAFKHVGNVVEIVGRIVSVRRDKTRHGKPFAFVNFADWRGKAVKLTIWSEILLKMQKPPTTDWVDKWVSVIGMIDPLYTSKKYGYEHLAITISNPHQINIISEDVAKWRLASEQFSTQVHELSSNREKISPLTGRPAGRSGGLSQVPLQFNPAGARSNRDLIARLKQKAVGPTVPVSPVQGLQQTPPGVTPMVPKQGGNASRGLSSNKGCNAAVLFSLMAGLVMLLFGSRVVRFSKPPRDSEQSHLIERS
jgi:hypothetical protein